jgi:hypothetical protein
MFPNFNGQIGCMDEEDNITYIKGSQVKKNNIYRFYRIYNACYYIYFQRHLAVARRISVNTGLS